MTKLLVIKAHPLSASESRSVYILQEFLQRYKETNPEDEITIVDLYQDEFPEIDFELMTAWQALKNGSDYSMLPASQQGKVARFNQSTQQFMEADKIVIANALWNLNIPSRLKSWFDTICVSGTTFRYTENGPVGMVKGKKALHIQANGGSYNGQDFSAQYVKGLLAFVGIDQLEQIFIEGIDHHPEQAEEIISAKVQLAQTIAEHF